MSKPRLISFYLPQFYPTKENDEWWHKGFTEWTNVGNAKPLFRGHYQPRVPADLGYYDLRVPEVREEQAQLACEAGIEGFCYWHYWFAGRRLLDRVFREVVESGKPDFPFCLCWANHSWYQKTWDISKPDKLLVEQTYPGEQDYIAHFYAMLPAFKDKRYMKADGKLIFGIFDSHTIPSFDVMRTIWDKLAKENGLPGFYFFGLCQGENRLQKVKECGYDAIVYDHMKTVYGKNKETLINRIIRYFTKSPLTLDYSKYVDAASTFFKDHPTLIPCLVPNFDHSPRSLHRGIVLEGSTPYKWGILCENVREMLNKLDMEEKLVFIKSWNEWGEGNYMEPDLKYGKGYIDTTYKVFCDK